MAAKKPNKVPDKGQRHRTAEGYERQDPYWAKAKDEGYAARSIYKLQEIDREHHVLQPGSRVLDLGCAPGSWLQYAGERVGSGGRVLGVDLEKVTAKVSSNVIALQQDMYTLTPQNLPEGMLPLDVILSDLAPHTTGIRNTDQARAFHMSARAILFADTLLRLGGGLVVKTFQGPDTPRLIQGLRKRFDEPHVVRPKATRTKSFEVYLVGKGYKGAPPESEDPLAVL